MWQWSIEKTSSTPSGVSTVGSVAPPPGGGRKRASTPSANRKHTLFFFEISGRARRLPLLGDETGTGGHRLAGSRLQAGQLSKYTGRYFPKQGLASLELAALPREMHINPYKATTVLVACTSRMLLRDLAPFQEVSKNIAI